MGIKSMNKRQKKKLSKKALKKVFQRILLMEGKYPDAGIDLESSRKDRLKEALEETDRKFGRALKKLAE